MNPYEHFKTKTGKCADPFTIADDYNLPSPAFECLKKLLCPGIEGRTKTRKQDLQDALSTLRLCEERKENFRQPNFFPRVTVPEVLIIYDLQGTQALAVMAFLNWALSSYETMLFFDLCASKIGVMLLECKND